MKNRCWAAVIALWLAGLALGAPLPDAEFAALKKRAKSALKAGAVDEARVAVAALAKDDSARAVEALLKLASKRAPAEVHTAVLQGLSAMSSDESAQAIAAAIGGEKGAKRLLAIDAGAALDDDATAGALVAALAGKAKEEEVRALVQAVRRRRLGAAMPVLIDLLAQAEVDDPGGLLDHLVQDALSDIAGERKDRSQDWRAYWKERADGFRPRTGSEPLAGVDAGSTRTRPTFFGTEIVSNRVVFVIDVSKSMEREDPDAPDEGAARPMTGGPDAKRLPRSDSRVRMERAKFQLAQCIDALPAKAKFTIVAYSGYIEDARALGEGYRFPADVKPDKGKLPLVIGGVPWLLVWKPKLAVASAGNKKSARGFVARLEPNGSTFTLRALKVALAVPGADAIVLLSDGSPTEIKGQKAEALLSAREILDDVAGANRLTRRRIDTFGVGVEDEEDFGRFLRDLAAEHQGQFTRVR